MMSTSGTGGPKAANAPWKSLTTRTFARGGGPAARSTVRPRSAALVDEEYRKRSFEVGTPISHRPRSRDADRGANLQKDRTNCTILQEKGRGGNR